jgi:pimeloyl-ACP methyl ester carboxylesterase
MKQEQSLDIYLVIGLTKESRHWSQDFISELKQVLNPKEIHLVDLPGSGKFLSQKSPTSVAKIVDMARSHQTFNHERKRLIVAISLGGMVAWEWVTRYPNDFDAMVMINSSLAGISPTFKRLQPKALIDFFRIAAAPKGTVKEKLILDLCSNHTQNASKIHPHWTQLSLEANMHFPNVLSQLLAGMRFRPKKIPSLPLLVVAAKHDRLAHYSCSETIANLSKAKFVLCEDQSVGHAFHVDGPEFLVKEIKEWLTEKNLIQSYG